MKKIRSLRADEIEVRANQITANGAQLLLYKNARVDKRILDETFGTLGWSNCYSEIKGNLYCSIMIYDKETGMFIQKQDAGVESNTAKEKGEASDAFKRAGFNVGIGRELYTEIFIFVKVPTKEQQLPNGKKIYKLENPYEKWKVTDIQTNEEKEKIEYLQIADSKGNIVFTYGKKKVNTPKQTKKIQKEDEIISKEQRLELIKKANGNNEVGKRVLERYGYKDSERIKVSDYEKICNEIESEINL